MQRAPFLALLEREPKLAIHLLQLFCERLRSISEMVEDSALLPVPARLAKRLLILASQHGKETDQGVELNISQSELGHFLSISRQIVNRYLQAWRKNGWVDLGRGKILIRDATALRDGELSNDGY